MIDTSGNYIIQPEYEKIFSDVTKDHTLVVGSSSWWSPEYKIITIENDVLIENITDYNRGGELFIVNVRQSESNQWRLYDTAGNRVF